MPSIGQSSLATSLEGLTVHRLPVRDVLNGYPTAELARETPLDAAVEIADASAMATRTSGARNGTSTGVQRAERRPDPGRGAPDVNR